jgi:hypothetical protein
MTQTFQPRATARRAVPNAAVDLPLPSPVLTSTSEGAERRAGRCGGSTGGRESSGSCVTLPPASLLTCRLGGWA